MSSAPVTRPRARHRPPRRPARRGTPGTITTGRSSLPGRAEPAMDTRSRPAVGMTGPGTDPAALRVITVAVLAGLVVSGIVVISRHSVGGPGRAGQQAMVWPLAPSGLSRAAAPREQPVKLLSQAAQACQRTT